MNVWVDIQPNVNCNPQGNLLVEKKKTNPEIIKETKME